MISFRDFSQKRSRKADKFFAGLSLRFGNESRELSEWKMNHPNLHKRIRKELRDEIEKTFTIPVSTSHAPTVRLFRGIRMNAQTFHSTKRGDSQTFRMPSYSSWSIWPWSAIRYATEGSVKGYQIYHQYGALIECTVPREAVFADLSGIHEHESSHSILLDPSDPESFLSPARTSSIRVSNVQHEVERITVSSSEQVLSAYKPPPYEVILKPGAYRCHFIFMYARPRNFKAVQTPRVSAAGIRTQRKGKKPATLEALPDASDLRPRYVDDSNMMVDIFELEQCDLPNWMSQLIPFYYKNKSVTYPAYMDVSNNVYYFGVCGVFPREIQKAINTVRKSRVFHKLFSARLQFYNDRERFYVSEESMFRDFVNDDTYLCAYASWTVRAPSGEMIWHAHLLIKDRRRQTIWIMDPNGLQYVREDDLGIAAKMTTYLRALGSSYSVESIPRPNIYQEFEGSCVLVVFMFALYILFEDYFFSSQHVSLYADPPCFFAKFVSILFQSVSGPEVVVKGHLIKRFDDFNKCTEKYWFLYGKLRKLLSNEKLEVRVENVSGADNIRIEYEKVDRTKFDSLVEFLESRVVPVRHLTFKSPYQLSFEHFFRIIQALPETMESLAMIEMYYKRFPFESLFDIFLSKRFSIHQLVLSQSSTWIDETSVRKLVLLDIRDSLDLSGNRLSSDVARMLIEGIVSKIGRNPFTLDISNCNTETLWSGVVPENLTLVQDPSPFEESESEEESDEESGN